MHTPIYVSHWHVSVSVSPFVSVCAHSPAYIAILKCIFQLVCELVFVSGVCVCDGGLCLHSRMLCLWAPSVLNLALIQHVCMCCCGVTGLTTFSFKIPVIRYTAVCSVHTLDSYYLTKWCMSHFLLTHVCTLLFFPYLAGACHTYAQSQHTTTLLYGQMMHVKQTYTQTRALGLYITWSNDACLTHRHTHTLA